MSEYLKHTTSDLVAFVAGVEAISKSRALPREYSERYGDLRGWQELNNDRLNALLELEKRDALPQENVQEIREFHELKAKLGIGGDS